MGPVTGLTSRKQEEFKCPSPSVQDETFVVSPKALDKLEA
ncbi:hypothetical protein RAB80_003359 [Fusarium oxysporum f. sp. vasinfectum]|nr:hypothetical protein RAB80_003359 [Fusarium oxysporum f. sp. vasinfectum]KAK2695502.1 hypothetical protein QWA68_006550 [Fusarium oxysporum]